MRKRLSAYVLMDALQDFYNQNELLPRGVTIAAPSFVDWSCRNGNALRKLVFCLHPPGIMKRSIAVTKTLKCPSKVTKFKTLLRRARSSRNSVLMQLKRELADYLPGKTDSQQAPWLQT